MEKEIVESNKLIAEFMGLIAEKPIPQKLLAGTKSGKTTFTSFNSIEAKKLIGKYTSDLNEFIELSKYHTSWDWLMPAVKKWNDLVISKRTGGAGWTKWQYKTVMLRTEINPVFKDLVEALKWYNLLPNEQEVKPFDFELLDKQIKEMFPLPKEPDVQGE